MPTGQYDAVDTQGGYLSLPKLSKALRHAAQPEMRFRQFVHIKEAWGKQRGDTVEFDKISNISTAGGTLVETNTMPEHQFTIAKGTITITEYGNAIPYTGKLEALSEFNVDNPVLRVLRDDEAKVIDSAVATQFKATESKYVILDSTSGTLTTNGTASGTAGANCYGYHAKQCIDQLKKWNVPYYAKGDMLCIGSIDFLRGLKDDTNAASWVEAAKYGDPKRLFAGEVGRWYGCRFVECNNSAVLCNTLGGSYGEAVFFGGDAVMEGVAVPEEIRKKELTDYGRSKGYAWYCLLGWKIIWLHSGDTESHIIHVTSL